MVGGPKNKPRHPGPRGSGELGEDHDNQRFCLNQVFEIILFAHKLERQFLFR